jgi:LCP family protein required for cell wall assembly
VFVAGSLFFGYLFYASIRDIVAYAELPFLTSGPAGLAHPSGFGGSGLVSQRQLNERVNILFIGIDRRENEPGPWRTDTLILFSMDPISNTASMLSIPRDLWVTLPGYNIDERINAAHVYGEQLKYPGGGPELAKRTVQYNLGIPVHYYARLDFVGFEKIIDAIGGIEIDVPREIIDYSYPTPNYGTVRLHIKAGRQQMDGALALKYARTRHGSSDVDRARRQQQVVMAVRDKLLKLNFPIARIPEQLRLLGDSLHTDMNLEVLYAVAHAARLVPNESIQTGIIDDSMVISWTTPQGWDVLVPRRERVRALVTELFPAPTPQVPLGPLGDRERLAQESARVEVQNGTQTAGLASRRASDLRANGYNVVRYGNADRFDYPETVIICYVERQYTLASLKAYLDVPDTHVIRQELPNPDVDIRVILGKNAVSP